MTEDENFIFLSKEYEQPGGLSLKLSFYPQNVSNLEVAKANVLGGEVALWNFIIKIILLSKEC